MFPFPALPGFVRRSDIAPRNSLQQLSAWPYCLGRFTPVLAKHTKHLSLVEILSVGVGRMQRNFEPMRKQVNAWKRTRLPDNAAKLVIYRAFIVGELDAPKHLARRVHERFQGPRPDPSVQDNREARVVP